MIKLSTSERKRVKAGKVLQSCKKYFKILIHRGDQRLQKIFSCYILLVVEVSNLIHTLCVPYSFEMQIFETMSSSEEQPTDPLPTYSVAMNVGGIR